MKLLKVDTIEQTKDKLANCFCGLPRKTEMIPLSGAVGRTLAEDIASDTDMPEFTRSVVDGYAVKASDTFGVGDTVPVFLKIIGEAKMGTAIETDISSGETVYVPTGGMLPAGADAMVMIEYTELLSKDTVAIYKSAAPGNGVMSRGEDFSAGKILLRDGDRISVKEIGLLACLGKSQVKAYRKPKVALISTGDELVEVDQTPLPGQIRDINSHVMDAFLERLGAEVTMRALAKDDFDALRAASVKALETNDIVLISGGSSQGNKDMTESVITSLGAPGVFTHGIAIKPGKPTILGAVEDGEKAKLVAGLPGHPMSAIVVYMAVIEPFIKQYYLNSASAELRVLARIAENIHAGEGRETWQPVKINRLSSGELAAVPIHAKSGSIHQLVYADGFVRIPVMSEGIDSGDVVEVALIQS